MTIYRRGGVYWFEFHFRSKRVRESTHTSNAKRAREIEAKKRVDLAEGRAGIKRKPESPRFKDIVEGVIAKVTVDSHEYPRTAAFYRHALNRVLAYRPIANAKLDDIDAEKIEAFTRSELKKVSVTTTNHSLRALRRSLRLAAEWGKLDRVPKVSILKNERKRSFVLKGEIKADFLKGLAQPARDASEFMLDTTLRISELCGLQWPQVVTADDTPDVYGHVTVTHGKSEYAKRTIPLTKNARRIIDKQRQLSTSKFVFVRYGPKVKKDLQFTAPLSRFTISEQFSKRRDELGLPWDAVLHSTRHTAGTDLAESGADPFVIQRVMGHHSVTVSQRYIHPVSEHVLRSMQRLNAMRSAEEKGTKNPEVPTDIPTAKSASVGK